MGPASDDDPAQAQTVPGADSGGSIASPATPSPDGERYLLLDRIGEGGMGVVWAAYDRRLDRKVALKLLRDAYLGADNQERLAREARAMARLAHPNVVPVFDVGERDGRTYLTMEFVKGGSLVEWLRTRRRWPEIVEVFRAAASGLAAAHDAGIVHRDVKPGNILLGGDGRARVADFGVSRADRTAASVVPAGAHPTETAGPVGSPAYMAPEQLRGERADARCDQFGLCVALHEALTGARPFAGATVEGQLQAIAKGPPPLGGDVPEWLARVVARGTAADPAARFASMSELAAALEGPRPSRSRRNVAIAALVAGGAAAAVIGTVLMRPEAARAPAPPDCAAESTAAADASWNRGRRDAMVAAFARTGAVGAAEEAERVAGAIDRHVAAWQTRWEQTCRAARIEHSWPADLGVMSRTCLAEQQQRFTALFDALGRPDASTVANGYDLVTRLEPPSPCGDPDLLRAQMAPPRDPARAAEIEALERRADALSVAMTLARDDEVARDLPTFLADAARTGDARMQAEALHLSGMAARNRGDHAAAIVDLKQAYLLARRNRDVAQAAVAAADLVWSIGYFQANAEAGEDWANLALVEIETIPTSREAVRVHQAIGVLAESRGQGPRSIEHQQRALELARRYYGPDHFITAKAIDFVASALGRAGRPAEAAKLYAESMPMVAKGFGERSAAYAHLLSDYAIVLKNSGDDVTAISIAEQSLEVGRAGRLGGGDLASLLLNHGAVLQEAERMDQAIAQLRAARAAFLDAGMPAESALALSNLGRIGVDQVIAGGGPPVEAQAIADLEEAARLLEKEWGPTDQSLALSLSSLALLHAARGRCARALPLAERAISIYEASPDLPDVADPLLLIARCHINAGKPTLAIPLLERAGRVLHAGGNDPVYAAELDAWLAIALRDTGDRARAESLIGPARLILSPHPRFADLLERWGQVPGSQ